jgi:cytosine/adenosine deaminase-related metal-dependent hydrolase
VGYLVDVTKTAYRAPWIIAFQDGEHRLLRDGVVVVSGSSVVHVGPELAEAADRVVDLPETLITPGFISTHAHLHSSPVDKSVQEDVGNRQFWLTGLIEILPLEIAGLDAEAKRLCVDYSLPELVRGGVTTVMEIGDLGEYVAQAAERAGLRCYVGETYRSARWYTPDGRRVDYDWDEAGGERAFERAVRLIERLDQGEDGLVRGFLAPAQVDTCSEKLLRETARAAEQLDVPVSIHAAQGVWEFNEMTRRHGLTPIEWLHSLDFLSARTIIGHGIFTTGHSWVNFAGDDLRLLAETNTAVAYSCWCFARRGFVMESFSRYIDAGVRMCLGTDTAPQSMIDGMRWTAVTGKIASRRSDVSTARDVFDAATVNAADSLGRADLGRIERGAKADLLFWDTATPRMSPLRDPLRTLVYYATEGDLRDVMVNGTWVMRDRAIDWADETDLSRRLQRAARKMWQVAPEVDWASRTLDEMCPPLLEDFA